MATKTYTAEEKQAWKEEQIEKQKQLLKEAVANLATSEGWTNWVKFGRSNLRRLTFNNAMLIFSQKRDASVVWGRKQWEKQGVKLNSDAQALAYFAPMFFTVKKNGKEVIGSDGKPMQRVWFKTVRGYDVSDTDAPVSDFNAMVELDGDDLLDYLAPLEQWARILGYAVKYKDESEMNGAHGYVDERNWIIAVRKDFRANALVRTLIHELFHVYGNVNYKDFSQQEAEVIVESATVMALGVIGFDVSKASVPYITSWGDGDTTAMAKFAKLVDALVGEGVERMGIDWKKISEKELEKDA